ncbi:MAG: hemerythrin family protein [Gammaproteobacteria bacterium]|nr:hemerythrin family protein [Gammaproteobacteria bacterium]MCP5407817.1 hemerythrin family protein [Chromatiaceae bacterium]MCP5441564.1 hemerythrin family protein [Chromatiaceae bacterium]
MKYTRPLVLDESALTGVEEIDHQHQHLLNLINHTHLSLLKNGSPVNTRSLVRELLGYSIYHFNTEESLLKQYATTEEEKAEADKHISQHRLFSQRVVLLQEKLVRRQFIDTDELLSFLTGWINDHVLLTDKALAGLILDRQKSES